MRNPIKRITAFAIAMVLCLTTVNWTMFAGATADTNTETEETTAVAILPEDAAEGQETEATEAVLRQSYDGHITVSAADGSDRNVTVTVEADEGTFPEGASLSVKSVPAEEQPEIDAAVKEERASGANVAASYTFDIAMLDAEGTELQPANGGNVKVSFAMAEIGNTNLDTQIYHIHEELPATENAAGEAGPAPALSVVPLAVETDGETASVSTDGFSYYTVEFTYNELTYVMRGDSAVALNTILSDVGLAGNVTAVEVSDSALISAENEGGTWTVTAHQAFSTTEWMKVTIGGIVYEITVTDDPADPTIVQSGTIGSGVTWELDDQGLLTIRPTTEGGTGSLPENTSLYGNPTTQDLITLWPYLAYSASITSVVVKEGVVAYGQVRHMFNGCTALASVDLSGMDNSSRGNANDMFRNCSSLTEVTISGLTASCTQLHRMFQGCTALETVTFENCNLSNVTQSTGNNSPFAGLSNLTTLAVSNTTFSSEMLSALSAVSSLTTLKLTGALGGTSLDTLLSSLSNISAVEIENTSTSSIDLSSAPLNTAFHSSGSAYVTVSGGEWTFTPEGGTATVYDATELSAYITANGGKLPAGTLVKFGLGVINVDAAQLEGNIWWKIDNNKLIIYNISDTLDTISGTYSSASAWPWDAYRPAIKEIQVQPNVGISSSSAKDRMFAGCTSATSADLSGLTPNSWGSNISNMFTGCTALETLNISGWKFSGNLDLGLTDCAKLTTVIANPGSGDTYFNDGDIFKIYLPTGTWKLDGNKLDIEKYGTSYRYTFPENAKGTITKTSELLPGLDEIPDTYYVIDRLGEYELKVWDSNMDNGDGTTGGYRVISSTDLPGNSDSDKTDWMNTDATGSYRIRKQEGGIEIFTLPKARSEWISGASELNGITYGSNTAETGYVYDMAPNVPDIIITYKNAAVDVNGHRRDIVVNINQFTFYNPDWVNNTAATQTGYRRDVLHVSENVFWFRNYLLTTAAEPSGVNTTWPRGTGQTGGVGNQGSGTWTDATIYIEDGTANQTFLFYVGDLDVERTTGSDYSRLITDASGNSTKYGVGSEGVDLRNGFDLDTISIADTSTLETYDYDGSNYVAASTPDGLLAGHTRFGNYIVGTKSVDNNDPVTAAFYAAGKANGASFVWTSGVNCDTKFLEASGTVDVWHPLPPVYVRFLASKNLVGKTLTDGAFTFTLAPDASKTLASGNLAMSPHAPQGGTVTNTADGNVIFPLMEFASSDDFDPVGEYWYTISEVDGNDPRIRYDDNVYKIRIVVEGAQTDLAAQTLGYTLSVYAGDAADPFFTTHSKLDVTYGLAKKAATGATDPEFLSKTFTASNGTPYSYDTAKGAWVNDTTGAMEEPPANATADFDVTYGQAVTMAGTGQSSITDADILNTVWVLGEEQYTHYAAVPLTTTYGAAKASMNTEALWALTWTDPDTGDEYTYMIFTDGQPFGTLADYEKTSNNARNATWTDRAGNTYEYKSTTGNPTYAIAEGHYSESSLRSITWEDEDGNTYQWESVTSTPTYDEMKALGYTDQQLRARNNWTDGSGNTYRWTLVTSPAKTYAEAEALTSEADGVSYTPRQLRDNYTWTAPNGDTYKYQGTANGSNITGRTTYSAASAFTTAANGRTYSTSQLRALTWTDPLTGDTYTYGTYYEPNTYSEIMDDSGLSTARSYTYTDPDNGDTYTWSSSYISSNLTYNQLMGLTSEDNAATFSESSALTSGVVWTDPDTGNTYVRVYVNLPFTYSDALNATTEQNGASFNETYLQGKTWTDTDGNTYTRELILRDVTYSEAEAMKQKGSTSSLYAANYLSKLVWTDPLTGDTYAMDYVLRSTGPSPTDWSKWSDPQGAYYLNKGQGTAEVIYLTPTYSLEDAFYDQWSQEQLAAGTWKSEWRSGLYNNKSEATLNLATGLWHVESGRSSSPSHVEDSTSPSYVIGSVSSMVFQPSGSVSKDSTSWRKVYYDSTAGKWTWAYVSDTELASVAGQVTAELKQPASGITWYKTESDGTRTALNTNPLSTELKDTVKATLWAYTWVKTDSNGTETVIGDTLPDAIADKITTQLYGYRWIKNHNTANAKTMDWPANVWPETLDKDKVWRTYNHRAWLRTSEDGTVTNEPVLHPSSELKERMTTGVPINTWIKTDTQGNQTPVGSSLRTELQNRIDSDDVQIYQFVKTSASPQELMGPELSDALKAVVTSNVSYCTWVKTSTDGTTEVLGNTLSSDVTASISSSLSTSLWVKTDSQGNKTLVGTTLSDELKQTITSTDAITYSAWFKNPDAENEEVTYPPDEATTDSSSWRNWSGWVKNGVTRAADGAPPDTSEATIISASVWQKETRTANGSAGTFIEQVTRPASDATATFSLTYAESAYAIEDGITDADLQALTWQDGEDVYTYDSENSTWKKNGTAITGVPPDTAVATLWNASDDVNARTGYVFTNYALTELTVQKTVLGDDRPTSDVFTFSVRIETNLPYTPAAGDGLTESNGVWTGTFTLSESAGLTRVFSGIPVGASYTVSETDLPAAIAGSTWQLINKTGDSGTLPENGATAAFTNQYTETRGVLTIQKTVSGSMGNKTLDWTFTVTIGDNSNAGQYATLSSLADSDLTWSAAKSSGEYADKELRSVTWALDDALYIYVENDGQWEKRSASDNSLLEVVLEPAAGTTQSQPTLRKKIPLGTAYTFTLQHGESLSISDLPYGVAYTVTESNVANGKNGEYTVTATVDGTAYVAPSAWNGSITGTVEDSETVAFNNALEASPPTGIADDLAPAYAGLATVTLLLAVLLLSRKKRYEGRHVRHD